MLNHSFFLSVFYKMILMIYCVPDPVLSILHGSVLLYHHLHMQNRKIKWLAWVQQHSCGVQHTTHSSNWSRISLPELFRILFIFWKIEVWWTYPCFSYLGILPSLKNSLCHNLLLLYVIREKDINNPENINWLLKFTYLSHTHIPRVWKDSYIDIYCPNLQLCLED